MQDYKEVLAKVELALIKGEYDFCIKFLSPIIESFPISSKEGINLRTIMITALCGMNKKDEAKLLCQDLLKSYNYEVRENAKYLLEVIDSPEIKTPDNWNITFESNMLIKKQSLNSIKRNKPLEEKKRFINTSSNPTGETKTFQKGFIFIISLFLLLLIPLLSGCVKIENTLDLREINAINNNLKIESKHIQKIPWQINFEEKIKDIISDSEISKEELNFSLKNKNLEIENAIDILNKIQKTASEMAGISTDIKIDHIEKNFILFKKYSYKIDFDLKSLDYIDDLELYFNIINPNKVNLLNNNNKIEISQNIIKWNLIPGKINSLEFSFLNWNKLLIGILIITLLISSAYFVKYYRYQLGSDLPALPSK